ncbi:MAG: hypothetical protein MK171_08565 [Pirellulales bacterium]|nr:hypothetical protein [Pirellulales bacterium]
MRVSLECGRTAAVAGAEISKPLDKISAHKDRVRLTEITIILLGGGLAAGGRIE